MICARVTSALASATGLTVLLILTSAVQAQTVWSGLSVEFSKPLFADPTLPENQDRITDNVWLTRGFNRGLFNASTETGYIDNVSPADTEWATGLMPENAGRQISAANFSNLTFTDWVNAYGGLGSNQLPTRLVSNNAVVHLISDDIYLDLQFTDWSVGAGAFTYQRATGTITPPTSTGDYNGDGTVDAADYVAWRNALGESVANEGDGADGDRDGMIDLDDYAFWHERFGSVVGGVAVITAVPEPASAFLVLFSALIAYACYSVRRRGNW